MEGISIQELIELGGDTPILIVIAYFIWKLDKSFASLSAEMKLFMGMHADDGDDE